MEAAVKKHIKLQYYFILHIYCVHEHILIYTILVQEKSDV